MSYAFVVGLVIVITILGAEIRALKYELERLQKIARLHTEKLFGSDYHVEKE